MQPHTESPSPESHVGGSAGASLAAGGTANGGSNSGGKNGKKPRKAYTITKPRESWTKQEHDRFVEGLKLYERDWKKIESFVKTKTVIQIRSHAQKFFLKMQKQGNVEAIPPPRPKRRISRSSSSRGRRSGKKRRKNGEEEEGEDDGLSDDMSDSGGHSFTADGEEDGEDSDGQEHSERRSRSRNSPFEADEINNVSMEDTHPDVDGVGGAADVDRPAPRKHRSRPARPPPIAVNGMNGTGRSLGSSYTPASQWQSVEQQQYQELQQEQLSQAQFYLQQAITAHAESRQNEMADGSTDYSGPAPDFSRVYSFLGRVFDPSAQGVIEEELESMPAVDRDLVQVLMHNLATNMSQHAGSQAPLTTNQLLQQMHAMNDRVNLNGTPGGPSHHMLLSPREGTMSSTGATPSHADGAGARRLRLGSISGTLDMGSADVSTPTRRNLRISIDTGLSTGGPMMFSPQGAQTPTSMPYSALPSPSGYGAANALQPTSPFPSVMTSDEMLSVNRSPR